MYHKAICNQLPIILNTNQAAQSAHVSYFNNTSPTANVVTFGNGGDANQGGGTTLTYIMYAWHNVPGLQKFGSFEGNENAVGPYVELGFRPAIVLLKAADDAANWMLYDNKRGTSNPNNFVLSPNVTDSGNTYNGYSSAYPIDFLSNGFKVRTNITNSNKNTVIYMAWAEAPSVNLYGGQSNAR